MTMPLSMVIAVPTRRPEPCAADVQGIIMACQWWHTRFMNALRSAGGRCHTVAGPSNLPICLNIAATT